jgi:predicted DNA-binding transcriptional regulator AlpA
VTVAHVPGYLCVAEAVEFVGVPRSTLYRLASRHDWRTAKRPGHREVYYNIEDMRATRDHHVNAA